MLELKGVTHGPASARIADAVTVSLEPGRPVCILGLEDHARGRIFRLLAGNDRPSAGSIRLNGKDVSRARGKVREVKAPRPGGKDRLKQLRQAMQSQAKLVLVDRPTHGLAKTARTRVLAALPGLLAGSSKTVIVFAESAEEARAAGGVALILHRGRVAQFGPAEDVFSHAETLASAHATAYPQLNVIDLEAVEGARRLPDGAAFNPPHGVHLPEAGRCTIAFRPQDVQFKRPDETSVRLVAKVVGEERTDADAYVALDFAGSRWLAKANGFSPAPGLVTGVFVAPSAIMVFDANGLLVETERQPA